MTAWLLPAGTVLAAAALAMGCGLDGLWGGVVAVGVVGAFWMVGQWRRWGWVASVALVLLIGAAAVGLRLGVGGGWMLVGVVAALVAWDLDRFAWRVRAAGRVEDADALERRHLQRLLAVGGAGLLLGAVALSFRIRLGFAVAFMLALLAVLGLSWAVGFLRRERD
ncbi:MAG: hypothetical protein JXA14_01135 [Anaerolineae bacterium]|nr:hypothetical protein [Anaerolineae bacterium]